MRWPVWTMIAGAASFIVGVIAHNLISAALHIEEPVFFIIAIIISPITVLIGFIGFLVHALRRKR